MLEPSSQRERWGALDRRGGNTEGGTDAPPCPHGGHTARAGPGAALRRATAPALRNLNGHQHFRFTHDGVAGSLPAPGPGRPRPAAWRSHARPTGSGARAL